MSKLKLLLLGGIFTLVGIFNFSSADKVVTVTCPGGDNNNVCSPNPVFSFSDPVSDFCFSVDDSYIWLGLDYGINGTKYGSLFDTDKHCIDGEVFSLHFYNVGFINDDNPWSFNVTYYNDDGGEGGEGGQVLPGGFSSLTPVIIGIQDTTIQLIPLVVYIGIGILLVILGFISIRWLVGWLVVKINNYFSSKRG